MSKKVSIVIPVYNGESFIVNCVNQMIAQDYENKEIIVVNDGSTDQTLQLLNEQFKNNKMIKVFSKKNGGTGSALNLGFSKSTGDLLTWASCDDVKYPFFISTLAQAMEDSGCEFCFSKFEQFQYSNFEARQERNPMGMQESGIAHNFLKVMSRYCCTGICFMYTRRLKNMCGPFEEIPGEDYIMGAKMGLLTDVYFVNKSLGAHRLHPTSLTISQPGCTNQADRMAKEILKNYA
jgi:glycosyltransferase involved in cell wall biosynthesis